MRPVLQENKPNKKLWILYLLIFLICVAGIGVALYYTGFQDENLGSVIGIQDDESEKEDEYNELKQEFGTIFTNQIDIFQQMNNNIKKINDNYDLVATPFHYEKNEENLNINVYIPYINIDNESAKRFNQKITDEYKIKAESLVNQVSDIKVVYSVEYRAYLQNNILSLAIRSEFKEGDKYQKIIVDTFNYNIVENREVTIDEVLAIKSINSDDATNKIRNEIKKIQDQNQPLIENGYSFHQRDYTLDIYNISNVKQFLYGKNGMLYIIYAYGNDEDTSEMDVVIFE